eukprot:CAMPEP_0170653786 /NCGR_PEP_ID=MMETSP0224-20130122/47586_1 /TAXON_ID=285029 /ORGANISM="Togula jolla, Strain CCCM 725" /LENGTH=181 /DNA_ID=CAMNT_0010985667 /DNA_START=77 /DNA_END=618 /DNA_ORIENTATION=+
MPLGCFGSSLQSECPDRCGSERAQSHTWRAPSLQTSRMRALHPETHRDSPSFEPEVVPSAPTQRAPDRGPGPVSVSYPAWPAEAAEAAYPDWHAYPACQAGSEGSADQAGLAGPAVPADPAGYGPAGSVDLAELTCHADPYPVGLAIHPCPELRSGPATCHAPAKDRSSSIPAGRSAGRSA